MNDLTLYSTDAVALEVTRNRGNYIIKAPSGVEKTLTRGTDFGLIRKPNGDALSKAPTLFKSGAEKVCIAYGLCQRYITETAIEDYENGFFYFRVRCDLVKIVCGREYIITSSGGSANTREKRCGSQTCYDGANSALKMAQKRALVSAALSLGCISDMFTQDIESDTDESTVYFAGKNPEAPISAAQVKFFYTATGRRGFTKSEAKSFLAAHGYSSAKDIKSGDFDALLDALDKEEDKAE